MQLRLSASPIAKVARNVPYTPGRDLRLSYTVEMDAGDYPPGTTLVSALLVAEPSFGLAPLVTKAITAVLSANGQITDTGADGQGALYFALAPGETTPLAQAPVAFEVIVIDSLGRQATLDVGSLVPTVSTVGAPVDHIVVAPHTFALTDPNTTTLTVTAFDADGNELTGRVVNWTSSDPATATIDPTTGLVTGIGAGNVLFTATIEGKSDTSTGTFTTNVTTVTVTPNPVAAPVGQTVALTAVAKDIGGVVVPNQTFEWASSNPLVATVDQAGVVTAVAIGTITISATIANTAVSGNTVLSVAPAQTGSVADVVYSNGGDAGVLFIGSPTDAAPTLDGSAKIRLLPDARGATYPVAKGGLEAASGAANPPYDSTSKQWTTGNFGEAITLDPAIVGSLRTQTIWMAVIGYLNPPTNATQCGGFISADWAHHVDFQGDFSGFIAITNTYSTQGFPVQSKVAPGTTLGLWILTHAVPLDPGGSSTLKLPTIAIEHPGSMRRMLTSPDFTNTYAQPPVGNWWAYLGARFFGSGNNPGATAAKAWIIGKGAVPSQAGINALQRMCTRLGIALTAPRPIGGAGQGNSRTWGDGASAIGTTDFVSRLQFYRGTNYDIVNRGVLGRKVSELDTAKVQQALNDCNPLRTKTWQIYFAGVNDDQNGVPAATIAAGAESWCRAVHASGCRILAIGEIAPTSSATRTALDTLYASLLTEGIIDAFYQPDLDPAFQDPILDPFHVYYDGLHLNDAGQDRLALGASNAMTTAGG